MPESSRQTTRKTIHVPTVGSKLSTAYEQLRNASEYAEDNLLRQRAVRRYLKRTLSFHDHIRTSQFAEELVTELTQAESIFQMTIRPKAILKQSQTISKRYYNAYWQYVKIRQVAKNVSSSKNGCSMSSAFAASRC